MNRTNGLVAALLWLTASVTLAQHEHHAPSGPTPTPTPAPAASDDAPKRMDMAGMDGAASAPAGGEAADPRRNLFQSDMSMMTGMTPRDAMAGIAGMAGWHVMDLGVARLAFNRQGGSSGGDAIESSNWNMVHAQTTIGPGRLSLMMMNSLEAATFAKLGSRELFQTGESYRGEPLVDRQHPHDFFMNLSATYRLNLGADAGAWIQLAPVGEPALGPVAFMHRASSGDNPTAPLGHHWEDSTHIAFHVVTLGGGWRWIAIEGSAFRGEEPDEHRWNIEGGRIDSASVRARLFLGGGWAGEISHGYLRHPEALEPGNTHRTTASVSYGEEGDRPLAVTLMWGRNDESGGGSDAYLLEGAYQLTASDQIFGRAELVQKDRALLLTKRIPAHHNGGAVDLVRVGAVTAGYVREFECVSVLRTGLGADATVYAFPASLKPVYGSFPLSLHAFLRLRWGSPHSGGSHAGHEGMKM
jgi:hypothetical protein